MNIIIFGDLLPKVLSFLHPRDRARAACVSPSWRNAVNGLPHSDELELPDALKDTVCDFFEHGGLSPDGTLFSTWLPSNAGICVWSIEDGTVLRVIPGDHAGNFGCRFFGPHHMFTAAMGQYRVVDVRTGEIVMNAALASDVDEDFACICPGDYDVDARVAVLHENNDISVYQSDQSDLLYAILDISFDDDLPLEDHAVVHGDTLSYSPSGEKLAVLLWQLGCTELRMWNILFDGDYVEWNVTCRWWDHEPAGPTDFQCMAWSTDSRFIAVRAKNEIRVYDTTLENHGAAFTVERGPAWCLDWNVDDDGRYLLLAVYVDGHIVEHAFRINGANVEERSQRVLARDRNARFAKFMASDDVLVATQTAAYFVQ